MAEDKDRVTDADIMPTSLLDEPDLAHDTNVSRSYTINRSRQEVWDAISQFPRWADFMENVKSIEARDERTSHWVVAGPAGKTVEWDAIITDSVPGERLEWRTGEGADIEQSGWIELKDAPGDRGTVIRALISYDPPGGVVGKAIAKVFQREPNIQLRRDLRRFKQLMETGEIPTSDTSVSEGAAPRGSFS